MKIVLSLLIITGFAANALAAKWEVDASHSNVTFTVKHMLSKVSGQFTDFAGSFEFDAKKPAASQGEVTIQAKSINTNANKRDEHLKSADFFDVEKFQTLTFKNGKLTPAGKTNLNWLASSPFTA